MEDQSLEDMCLIGNLEWIKGKSFSKAMVREVDNQALRNACSNGHLEVANYLVEKYSLGVNDVRAANNSILELACKNGEIKVVRWAISFGLTIEDVRGNHGNNNSFLNACMYGHFEIVKLLVGHFRLTERDVKVHDFNAFRFACEEGHFEIAKWLAKRFNISAEDLGTHQKSLAKICSRKHQDIAKWLISAGICLPD